MTTARSSKVWPLILGAFSLWDVYEDWVHERYSSRYKPWPLPSEENRLFDTSDVSIICPTIDFNESPCDLAESVRGWASNNPREVIFITTVPLLEKLRDIIATVDLGVTQVKYLTIEHPHKRDQLVLGINESKGSILALVDDDAFWHGDKVLLNLLAPFQDKEVGLVGGPITSHVPKDRRCEDIVTPWEVAALRVRDKRGNSMKAAFAADGGTNFCVSGVTMLLRGEILRDAIFQTAFTTDSWMGKRQNSGDDRFITRWVLFHHQLYHTYHKFNAGISNTTSEARDNVDDWGVKGLKKWKLAIQHTKEAVVSTSLHSDSRFMSQMKRWYRSGMRLRLSCLLVEPGFRAMRRTTPFMARKMVEGMLTPFLSWVRLIAQLKSFPVSPRFATLVFLANSYLYLKSITGFFGKFAWCKKYWWAALLVDRLYYISDFYCWATLGEESWTSRLTIDDKSATETKAEP